VPRQAPVAPRPEVRTGTGAVNVRVILWQNGFTINEDGPLRTFEDRNNRAFLMALQSVSSFVCVIIIFVYVSGSSPSRIG
jgi:hypothetical protein